MATSNYDPRNCNAAFGPLPMLGVASGTMFEVRVLGPGVAIAVGTQGEAVLIDSHNRSAEVTVRLMGTGLGRNTLSALRAHWIAGNPALPFNILSKDTGEALSGGVAKLKNPPDTSFGDDAPVREVTFIVARMDQLNDPDELAFA